MDVSYIIFDNIIFDIIMNFLNFLTAGASLFNFNLQNLKSNSLNKCETEQLGPQADPHTQLEALTQQQQLINQYMHLNLQLLNQKLQTLEKVPSSALNETVPKEQIARNGPKKTKKINKCGHEERQHYAKGMCNNCYHRHGRNKKPWNCPHEKLYAAGMCQNCYINNYNRKKRESRTIKDSIEPKLELESEFEIKGDYQCNKDSSYQEKKQQKINYEKEEKQGEVPQQ